ncbi:MAG: glycosyltransferase [Lachnospiraceae bacterium]|nr:glycosyltransferase [Lachnospiraceae bacterium]
MNQIKVSIIIPIYNVEEYLEECLVSAVNQTLKEIEIICVNDGTPDNSMSIVNRYAKDDSRIVIVEKENGGLSSARNAGIAVAKGEYVYFLDSDDYILEQTMEVLYEEASKYELDNIYFDAESFFETEDLKEEMAVYVDYYVRKADYSQVVSGVEMLKKMDENNEFRPSACLQMVKREFLLKHNIQFYPGIIHEDNLFSLECILEEERVKHIPEKFYMRRIREESIMTATKEFRSSFGYYMCLEGILDRLKGKEYPTELKEAITNRLCNIQSNALNKIMEIPEEEMEEFIKELPVRSQAMYKMLIKRMAEERQRGNREYEWKMRCEKRIERMYYNNDGLKGKIKDKEREIAELKNSSTYKVGKTLLAAPTAVSRIRYNAKTRGKKYVLWSLKNKFNKNDILVSIIIPVYNASQYLRACLETIEKQTLKNIEVICVNDGSEDTSLEILKEFAQKDSRFKVIDKENTGAGDCRNIGLKEAKGEYVLFLDADDKFSFELCDKAYFRAKTDKADICFFGAVRFNMQTKKNEPMNWVLRKELLPQTKPFRKEALGNRFFQMTSGCPWSKMFRREFILKHQLEFQNLQNANDLYFVRTAMALAENMTYVDEELVTYRYAAGANTQSTKHKAPLEFYKAYKALKDKLVKEKVYDSLEQSFVNLAFDDCMFNVRTTQTDEAKLLIKRTLRKEGFAYLGIEDKKEDYFYNKSAYKEYLEVK